MNWQYTDSTLRIATRALPDGSVESRLASAIPPEDGVILDPPPPPPPTLEELEALAAAADPNLIALLDAPLADLYTYIDASYADNPPSTNAVMAQLRKDLKTIVVAVHILGVRQFRR